MPVLETQALVLHAFDYLESSRIIRLLTREAGLRSVVAKGARRSTKRFGGALDLFALGHAQLYTKPGRDLDTLSAFDVQVSHAGLAGDLARFTGAAALAELILRFSRGEIEETLFETVQDVFRALTVASEKDAPITVLAGAWLIIGELGFAPTLETCADCHAPINNDVPVLFSHSAGGALCERCSRLARVGRTLPASARASLIALVGGTIVELDASTLRAHQRLLQEFLTEHLADGRPLAAFELWQSSDW